MNTAEMDQMGLAFCRNLALAGIFCLSAFFDLSAIFGWIYLGSAISALVFFPARAAWRDRNDPQIKLNLNFPDMTREEALRKRDAANATVDALRKKGVH